MRRPRVSGPWSSTSHRARATATGTGIAVEVIRVAVIVGVPLTLVYLLAAVGADVVLRRSDLSPRIRSLGTALLARALLPRLLVPRLDRIAAVEPGAEVAASGRIRRTVVAVVARHDRIAVVRIENRNDAASPAREDFRQRLGYPDSGGAAAGAHLTCPWVASAGARHSPQSSH